MIIPAIQDLHDHLRALAVVRAETNYLLVGGAAGTEMVRLDTGVANLDYLPSDYFADQETLGEIAIETHAITGSVEKLHALLVAHSLGGKAGPSRIDKDFIQQECLDFIELMLSSVPDVALGGIDWTSARMGAVRDLYLLGRAWASLIQIIDECLGGEFDGGMQVEDLALVAGIGTRTLRNIVGPEKQLRTVAQSKHIEGPEAKRSFVAINRFDAISWLVSRRDFNFASPPASSLIEKVDRIGNVDSRAKASIVGAMVLGETPSSIAAAIGCPQEALRLSDDVPLDPAFAQRLIDGLSILMSARSS